jgi:hypothetical protein
LPKTSNCTPTTETCNSNGTGEYYTHLQEKMTRIANQPAKDAASAAGSPTHEQIAARAYGLYLERGRQHGHDMDDWLQAEYELLQLPVEKLARLGPPKGATALLRRRSIVHVVQAALL